MYSGTIISRGSGRIVGAHQKIDRVSRRKLQPYLTNGAWFPRSGEILRFEGLNGPDGIKRKSPAHDEPIHFIRPDIPSDRHLLGLIEGHQNNLILALSDGNRERAAFEAAWMAHAMVDGLTPAHHYPYEERLQEIRGANADERDSIAKKFIMPGDTVKDKFMNNWEYWKPNGLMTAHGLYELGVAFISAPLRFRDVKLTASDRELAEGVDTIADIYYDEVQKIFSHHMYDQFLDKGWTSSLAMETKDFLMPEIIHTVLFGWYFCIVKAKKKV